MEWQGELYRNRHSKDSLPVSDSAVDVYARKEVTF